jgi:hypothetical protein
VVTVTPTVPVPAGAIAVIRWSLSILKVIAGVAPKSTAVAFLRRPPPTVTLAPPDAGPIDGVT